MSRYFRISEEAKADVDGIFAWLVRRSVRGAVSWYLAFRRALDQIQESPESFGEVAEVASFGPSYRQAFFKTRRGRTYRIVFRATVSEVAILRVRGPGQAPLKRGDV